MGHEPCLIRQTWRCKGPLSTARLIYDEIDGLMIEGEVK
jgi:hypothetical protein